MAARSIEGLPRVDADEPVSLRKIGKASPALVFDDGALVGTVSARAVVSAAEAARVLAQFDHEMAEAA